MLEFWAKEFVRNVSDCRSVHGTIKHNSQEKTLDDFLRQRKEIPQTAIAGVLDHRPESQNCTLAVLSLSGSLYKWNLFLFSSTGLWWKRKIVAMFLFSVWRNFAVSCWTFSNGSSPQEPVRKPCHDRYFPSNLMTWY